MLKNNPYYKRGRPSQQALDWEYDEVKRIKRGPVLNIRTGIMEDGPTKGWTWITEQYKEEVIYRFTPLAFITIPSNTDYNDNTKFDCSQLN